jgi:predicted SAM-dependent methyltransferase
MKIRITVGETEKLNGYVNIDPITKFDGIASDIRNLDDIVSDSECMEILSDDVIDFLEKKESMKVLSHWIKKIRHGGKIIVTSVDAYEVAKSFYRKTFDIDIFNKAIHGSFSEPWDVRLSHTTMEELSDFFQSQGLIVTKKRINGIKLTVEAERP